ncbi:phytoene/squalene synthase family protein [Nocardioides ferulae]|uniref:phytoene/squalene synthase family protein n=1 Tax=Nocardioides ferulae TaxID=2340821 RepID=UPI00197FB0A2|nr:squalene/phytoene synthase family protein [Nocardioides ferulae]
MSALDADREPRLATAAPPPAPEAPHLLYDRVAEASAALVIGHYSTSFGMACRLLREPVRTHVRNIYALVRVADELVDAPRPDGSRATQARLLDALEADAVAALRTGHSANLVVHAFARSARACGIGPELLSPFFESMRTDLFRAEHDQASFDRYVHGSAEVVGLMCLRAFLVGRPGADAAYDALAPGARRLGAAFQKINFLRDLGADANGLGRRYFPGVDPHAFDDAVRDRLLDDIDADLAVSAVAVALLPADSRRAVWLAHGLFAELSRRMRRIPADQLRGQRVRVPDPVKARVLARSLLRTSR